ncbi:ankyrin repeat-containing protein [Campylobacter geochelonis]|nr:ankyrin repeat-containing protein [Campylobacter geochelonis]
MSIASQNHIKAQNQNLQENEPNKTNDLADDISNDELKRYEELCRMAFDFARNDEVSELSAMLEHGLNVNLQNQKGDSLLMLATYNGSFECAKLLVKFGAMVDLKNDRGQTPLAGVCFKGNMQMVKLLVESGANIDENNGLGATPYTFAVMFGHKAIAKYLLENSKKKSLMKRISVGILSFFRRK